MKMFTELDFLPVFEHIFLDTDSIIKRIMVIRNTRKQKIWYTISIAIFLKIDGEVIPTGHGVSMNPIDFKELWPKMLKNVKCVSKRSTTHYDTEIRLTPIGTKYFRLSTRTYGKAIYIFLCTDEMKEIQSVKVEMEKSMT